MTHNEDALDALFAQAAQDTAPADLMARVVADADFVLAETPVAAPVGAAGRSWLAGLISGLGGWSALSGITAAGVMGLAVGLYSPDAVAGLLENDGLSLGIGAYDLTPDVSDLWTEDGDV